MIPGRNFVILTAILLFPASALFSQQVLYVDAVATGSNNGTSWTNAYTSLQSALSASASGDQIWVARGTYLPSLEVGGTGNRYKAFQMKNGVALIGGFAGTETDTSQRTSYGRGQTNETMLSGDLNGNGDDDQDCYNVIHNTADLGLTASSILSGFTLLYGGNWDGLTGAINNVGASPKIEHCYFTSNGQGISLKHSSSVIEYCTFRKNQCGIQADSSSPVISFCVFDTNNSYTGCGLNLTSSSSAEVTHCSFTDNGTVLIPTCGGGAIHNEGTLVVSSCTFTRNTDSAIRNAGSLRITQSTFTENFGNGSAGAIHEAFGVMNVSYCTFERNYTNECDIATGGDINILGNTDSDTISHCTFTGNSTYHNACGGIGGGSAVMINGNYYHILITHCTFTGYDNSYNDPYPWVDVIGGDYAQPVTIKIENCLFTKNKSAYPVLKVGGTHRNAEIINCTFSGNSSYCIYKYPGGEGNSVVNCILWGSDSAAIYYNNGGDFFEVSYSCVQGGFSGEGNISSDPLFVDTANGDYRLQTGSPCIGTGTTLGAPATDITDALRGVYVSMGAYENNTGDPMPVELTEFTAAVSGNKATLTWSTATETNNYGFEVERRKVDKSLSSGADEQTQRLIDSKTPWLKIGFVKGNGTRNSTKEYSFNDAKLPAGRYAYRLKQMDNDGMFKYSQSAEVEIGIPKEFRLSQNYPNPFNPSTVISYQLPVNSNVTLKVYDVIGREVAELVDEVKEAGSYEVTFDASRLASGMYFYRLQAGTFSAVKKLTLLK